MTSAGYTIDIYNQNLTFKIKCLIDSGASCSILDKSNLKHFPGFTKLNNSVELYGFNENKIQLLGQYILDINIPMYGEIKHPFIITMNSQTGIFGLDLIRKIKASLVFDESINRHCLSLPPLTSFVLKIVKPIELESNYVNVVKILFSTSVPLQNDQQLLIYPCENVLPSVGTVRQLANNTYEMAVACANMQDKHCILTDNLIAERFVDENDSFLQISKPVDLYEVDQSTYNKLSPCVPLFTNVNSTSILSPSTVSNLHHIVNMINSTSPLHPSVPLIPTLIESVIYENIRHNVSSVTNTPPPDSPPSPEERTKRVKDLISQLNIENDLKEMLYRHTNSFSAHSFDTGMAKTKFNFEFNPEFKRNKQVYRCCNAEKLKFMKEQLEILQFHKYLVKSTKNYGIPCFVTKSAGKYRLVFDARASNDAIPPTRTFFKDCHSVVHDIASSARFVTTFDLSKAYYGLPLDEKLIDSGFANILTEVGAFAMTSAVTGWSNVPAFLEEYMTNYLETNFNNEYDPIRSNTYAFFDDISCASDKKLSRQEHIDDVEELLCRIERSGLRISLAKSKICIDLDKQELPILGFVVKSGEISPDPSKLKVIKEMPLPKTLVKLQKYLGQLVYFRKHLGLHIGGAISKLHTFCSKDKFSSNNPIYAKCFNEVQKSLINLTIFMPKRNSLSILFTDASDYAYGAVFCNIAFKNLPRRKHKVNEFAGIIEQEMVERLDRSEQWLKYLKISSCHENILECSRILLIQLGYSITSLDVLKQTLYHQIFRRARFHTKSLPFTTNEAKSFFNEIYHALEFQDYNRLETKYDLLIKHFSLLELTRLLDRQIIFLTQNKHFFIGEKANKPPIFLFQTKSNYYSLYSHQPVLGFAATNQQDLMDLKISEIPQLLEKLSKDNNDFIIKPCGFMSKRLSLAQSKRPTWLNELFAINEALQYFDAETRYTRTVVISDNKPSCDLINNRKYNAHSSPILLNLLANYSHVSFAFLKGALNIADILSRPAKDNMPPLPAAALYLPKFSSEHIDVYYTYDDMLSSVLNENTMQVSVNTLKICYNEQNEFFKNKLSVDEFMRFTLQNPPINAKDFENVNGYLVHTNSNRRYLPEALHLIVISLTHRDQGHSGLNKILKSITSRYIVNNQSKLIEKIKSFLERCISCLLCEPVRKAWQRGRIWDQLSLDFGHYISLDLMEFGQGSHASLTTARAGKALIIYEHYSRHISGFLLHKGNESEILRGILAYLSTNPIPAKILMDNAPNLRALSTIKILAGLGITVVQSAPYHSESRANIERAVGRLRQQLWHLFLAMPHLSPQILLTIAIPLVNQTPFQNRILSPSEIKQVCARQEMTFLVNHPTIISDEKCHEIRRKINTYLAEMRKKEIIAKNKQLKAFNKHRLSSANFLPNDFVLLRKYDVKNKAATIFDNELYRVVKVYSHALCLERVADNIQTIRHPSQVKRVFRNATGSCDIPEDIAKMAQLSNTNENGIPDLDFSFDNNDTLTDGPSRNTRAQQKAALKNISGQSI